MTIFVTLQLIVTLDSFRNSCEVFIICSVHPLFYPISADWAQFFSKMSLGISAAFFHQTSTDPTQFLTQYS